MESNHQSYAEEECDLERLHGGSVGYQLALLV